MGSEQMQVGKKRDLRRAVDTLADWADDLPLKTVYVYGSRVRGDSRPDSDLDVAYESLPGAQLTRDAITKWQMEHETDFRALKQALGIRLQLLDPNDQGMLQRIKAAVKKPFLTVRKVVCVILPAKPT